MQYYDKPRSLNFPKLAKDLVSTLFSVAKITNELRFRLKNHTAQQEVQKKQILIFSSQIDSKTSFSSQNYFSQTEIMYFSKGVLFEQMKNSERRTESKKLKRGNFLNQEETSSVTYDQKNKMNK